MTNISTSYKEWLSEVKLRVRQSQLKAAVKVNTELIRLYWGLGKDISEKQLESVWGSGFFSRLSKDLKSEFPDTAGFSETNIKYMKRFYDFYSQSNTIRHQVGDEFTNNIFLIPWRHHVELFSKCKSKNEIVAQYTLESTSQPIGISEYQLSEIYPKEIENALPSIEEIEKELEERTTNQE